MIQYTNTCAKKPLRILPGVAETPAPFTPSSTANVEWWTIPRAGVSFEILETYRHIPDLQNQLNQLATLCKTASLNYKSYTLEAAACGNNTASIRYEAPFPLWARTTQILYQITDYMLNRDKAMHGADIAAFIMHIICTAQEAWRWSIPFNCSCTSLAAMNILVPEIDNFKAALQNVNNWSGTHAEAAKRDANFVTSTSFDTQLVLLPALLRHAVLRLIQRQAKTVCKYEAFNPLTVHKQVVYEYHAKLEALENPPKPNACEQPCSRIPNKPHGWQEVKELYGWHVLWKGEKPANSTELKFITKAGSKLFTHEKLRDQLSKAIAETQMYEQNLSLRRTNANNRKLTSEVQEVIANGGEASDEEDVDEGGDEEEEDSNEPNNFGEIPDRQPEFPEKAKTFKQVKGRLLEFNNGDYYAVSPKGALRFRKQGNELLRASAQGRKQWPRVTNDNLRSFFDETQQAFRHHKSSKFDPAEQGYEPVPTAPWKYTHKRTPTPQT